MSTCLYTHSYFDEVTSLWVDNNSHKSHRHKQLQEPTETTKPKHHYFPWETFLIVVGQRVKETPILAQIIAVRVGCLSQLEDEILFLNTVHILDIELGSSQ